jgi:Bacteriophage translational regulator
MINITDLVEVTLKEKDDFLKVRETLTRIGVASKKEQILYQSCHILHKQGHYYVVHFKELFALDGKPTDITENDLSRRNAIANLLQDWGLITIVNKEQTETPPPIFLSQIKIISHKEKNEWQLTPKYNIGGRKSDKSA